LCHAYRRRDLTSICRKFAWKVAEGGFTYKPFDFSDCDVREAKFVDGLNTEESKSHVCD
jgi:hypothetical protein